MATKKVKETEEIKETKEETVKAEVNLDVEAMMAKMKAELMKEIEERTKALDEREKAIENKEKEVSKPQARQVVDESREVIVRAIAYGTTTLRGREYDYPFAGYGDEMPISIKELKYIKASTPRALNKPLVIVEDEEANKVLGLTPLYEKLDFMQDIQTYCKKHTDKELLTKLLEIPQFIRIELFNTLVDLWNREDETQFRDYDLARILRKHFKFDLISYEKDVEE